MSGLIPFLPGHAPASPGPLSRYLPPIPDGPPAAWLSEHIPKGAWVLDPFGAAPRLAVEAARAGYRVLVTANNPIERFLLDLTADPPDENALRAALADLAVSHKGSERIEPHLRSLYMTECSHCNQQITAETFIWDREKSAPTHLIYSCPYCKDSGERPTTNRDIEKAKQHSATGLHHSRALERVALLDDPDRVHAEEALSAYLPRAVYALFTLVNKLESLAPIHRRSLTALLLTTFDQANTLWHYPTTRARPRQLTVPSRFREKNVWLALEEAIDQWTASTGNDNFNSDSIPITRWPDQPSTSGGLCIFEGRLKDFVNSLQKDNIKQPPIEAVIAAIPRPNQAYWTLSALWAGWLWGREATASFKSVLRRRRYDWSWHSTAVLASFKQLMPLLEPGTPFFGLVGEIEQGFLSSIISAGKLAGLDFQGISLRLNEYQAQITWQIRTEPFIKKPESVNVNKQQLKELICEKTLSYINKRGEPVSYLLLHTLALLMVAEDKSLPTQTHPDELVSLVNESLPNLLHNQDLFIHLGGSERSIEGGQWWLSEKYLQAEIPLSDRVEMETVRFLQKNPGVSIDVIDNMICKTFPGLFTPDSELLRECVASYGEEEPNESGRWQLRNEDAPEIRRQDLRYIRNLLIQIGQSLGYVKSTCEAENNKKISSQEPINWSNEDGKIEYSFYVTASAVIGQILSARPTKTDSDEIQYPIRLIVIPGGRSSLITYKLRNNQYLHNRVASSWRIIKFRLVRRLAQSTTLTRDNLENQLNVDPLASSDLQIPLW